jgi:hypothetical protein
MLGGGRRNYLFFLTATVSTREKLVEEPLIETG